MDEDCKADQRKLLKKMMFIYKTLMLGYSVTMVKGSREIKFTRRCEGGAK